MPLTSFDPFTQEFDRLAQRVFGTANGGAVTRWSVMPMDAIRSKDEVVLRFDLPGIDPESIEVTVDKGVLAVSARRAEEYAEGENPFIRERRMGSFARRVRLSDAVDTEKIDASYNDGVLSVRLPLLEKAQPRKVEIHTGDRKKIAA
ncbi:MAG TPA: Hsp20/alpha crystallin family protein [Streptosporangiaceae bacterium]|nr:Hsp20/alpha crystallin family protein [Streptosporangiaceae bacterium]